MISASRHFIEAYADYKKETIWNEEENNILTVKPEECNTPPTIEINCGETDEDSHRTNIAENGTLLLNKVIECGKIPAVEEDSDSTDEEDNIPRLWNTELNQRRSSINPDLLSVEHLERLNALHRRASVSPDGFSKLREACNLMQQRRKSISPEEISDRVVVTGDGSKKNTSATHDTDFITTLLSRRNRNSSLDKKSVKGEKNSSTLNKVSLSLASPVLNLPMVQFVLPRIKTPSYGSLEVRNGKHSDSTSSTVSDVSANRNRNPSVRPMTEVESDLNTKLANQNMSNNGNNNKLLGRRSPNTRFPVSLCTSAQRRGSVNTRRYSAETLERLDMQGKERRFSRVTTNSKTRPIKLATLAESDQIENKVDRTQRKVNTNPTCIKNLNECRYLRCTMKIICNCSTCETQRKL